MTDASTPKNTPLAKSGYNFADTPLKDKIGSDLKRLYDDIVNEEVPDDFLALLAKADTDT